MPTSSLSPITTLTSPQLLPTACQSDRGIPRVSVAAKSPRKPLQSARRPRPRILIRPQPGVYVIRLRSGAPLVAVVIYRLCPMVIPQPMTVAGPHPDR